MSALSSRCPLPRLRRTLLRELSQKTPLGLAGAACLPAPCARRWRATDTGKIMRSCSCALHVCRRGRKWTWPSRSFRAGHRPRALVPCRSHCRARSIPRRPRLRCVFCTQRSRACCPVVQAHRTRARCGARRWRRPPALINSCRSAPTSWQRRGRECARTFASAASARTTAGLTWFVPDLRALFPSLFVSRPVLPHSLSLCPPFFLSPSLRQAVFRVCGLVFWRVPLWLGAGPAHRPHGPGGLRLVARAAALVRSFGRLGAAANHAAGVYLF